MKGNRYYYSPLFYDREPLSTQEGAALRPTTWPRRRFERPQSTPPDPCEPRAKSTAQIEVLRTGYGVRTTIRHKGDFIGSLRFRFVGKARIQGKRVVRSNGIFLDKRYHGKGLAIRAYLATLRKFPNYWFVPDTNVSPAAVRLYRRLFRCPEVKTAPGSRFRSCRRTATWRWTEKGRAGTDWHGWYYVGSSRDRRAVDPACRRAYSWAG